VSRGSASRTLAVVQQWLLHQPLALEADVALAADHDVVVDRDAVRARGLDDLARHVHVGARGVSHCGNGS